MENSIEAALKRGRGYWFVDGFAEMAAGAFFVLIAFVVLLRRWVTGQAISNQIFAAGVDIAIVKFAGLILAVLVIWWLRDRFTYPRTGYARGKFFPAGQILRFLRNAFLAIFLPILALAIAFLLVPGLGSALFALAAWLPIFLGAIWGVLCYALGEWTGLRRFRLLGIIILLTGIAVAVGEILAGFPAASEITLSALAGPLDRAVIALSLLTLVSGAAFKISGFVTFLRYRKENPAPYGEAS